MGYRGDSNRARVTGSVEASGTVSVVEPVTVDGAVSLTGGTLGVTGAVSLTGGTIGVTGTVTVQDGGGSVTVDLTGGLTETDRNVALGKVFTHSTKHAAVGAGASTDHVLITPASPTVRLYDFTCTVTGGPCDVYLYEGITTSADGAASSMPNHLRSGSTAGTTMHEAANVTATGTQLKYVLIPGTKQDGGLGKANGGHYVLLPSTKYLIRVTNNSVSAQDIGVSTTIEEG